MPTTKDNAHYALTIVDEPQEDPIFLTQKEFETFISIGMSLRLEPEPADQEETENSSLVDFATLTPIDESRGYVFAGHTMDPDECQVYFERAFRKVLNAALRNHKGK